VSAKPNNPAKDVELIYKAADAVLAAYKAVNLVPFTKRPALDHNGAPPQASQTHTHGGANAWLWYWVAMNNSRAHGNSAPAAVFRYRDSTPPVMATRVASVRATARAPGGVASRGGVRGERRRVGRWVKTRFPVKQT